MNRKLRILLITFLIVGLLIAIPLIVLSFGTIDPGYMALCYDNIVSNYTSQQVFGPGTHFIGVARQFIRIKQSPTIVRIDTSTYTSDYFRLRFKLIITYQLKSIDFSSVDNFYINFGDDYQKTIAAVIDKKVISILSEYPSTMYKNTTYNAIALQALIYNKLTTLFQYQITVPLTLQVLIQSLVVEGATSTTESINNQVQNSLLQLQRAQNQKIQITSFIQKIKDRSQQQANIAYEIIRQRTQLVSELIDKASTFNPNFDMSMLLFGNTAVRNNLSYYSSTLRLRPELYAMNETNIF